MRIPREGQWWKVVPRARRGKCPRDRRVLQRAASPSGKSACIDCRQPAW
nr:hypothetical protein [Paraburkholderia piptadeniae]